MVSKTTLKTPKNSNAEIICYLRKNLKKIEKYYHKTNLKIKIKKTSGIWLDVDTKIMVIGEHYLKNKNFSLLALLHEMGHIYSFKESDAKYQNELNANLWVINCINKLYKKNLKLKKMFEDYIYIFCYLPESGDHYYAALLLYKTFKAVPSDFSKIWK